MDEQDAHCLALQPLSWRVEQAEVRRSRASAWASASSARIRASTVAAKRSVKPSVAAIKPHRNGPAIAEPPVERLGGWWIEYHQITE